MWVLRCWWNQISTFCKLTPVNQYEILINGANAMYCGACEKFNMVYIIPSFSCTKLNKTIHCHPKLFYLKLLDLLFFTEVI